MATPIKLVGGLTFISSFIRHILERKSWNFIKKPQIKFFALFLVWIFISGFTQPGSFTRENFTVFTSCAALGFIILSLVTNIKRFRVVVWTGLISISIISLNTVFNYSSVSQMMRAQGTAYGPNYFALGLLPFLGLAFYSTFVEKKKSLKTFSLAITLVITMALIFTFSRAGLIGFFALLLIAALKARKKVRALLWLSICIVVIINLMPTYVWERFEKTKIVEGPATGDIASTTRRFLLAKSAWRMFLTHPLFGVGVGNYFWECGKYEAVHPGRAHTTYLEIMAELGIIGIFLFLGVLFHTFKTLKKIMRNNSQVSSYAWGLYIGLAGFLIAALFLHAQQEKVLWFVVFMAVALERIDTQMSAEKEGRVAQMRRKKRKRVELS